MPKNKKNKTSKVNRVFEESVLEEDNYSEPGDDISDTTSIGTDIGDVDLEDTNLLAKIETKVSDQIEVIESAKGAQARIKALKLLRTALASRFLLDYMTSNRATVADSLRHSWQKGSSEEKAHVSQCYSVLILQCALFNNCDSIHAEFNDELSKYMLDPTASPASRAACVDAYGLSNFCIQDQLPEIIECMRRLQSIYKQSYLKGDRVPPVHAPPVAKLHAAALDAWTLLVTRVPFDVLGDVFDSSLHKLPEILESPDVDLRMAAAQAIGVLYEMARRRHEDFRMRGQRAVCDKLRELVTDSNKYHAKRDRRHQRGQMRDVLAEIEENEFAPVRSITAGGEQLVVTSWACLRQYEACTDCLGSGMRAHLQENEVIRQMFEANLYPADMPSGGGANAVARSTYKKEWVIIAKVKRPKQLKMKGDERKFVDLKRGKSRDNKNARTDVDDS